MRVVTWNIQKSEGGLDRVIAELAAINADVLLLQELIEPTPRADGTDQTQRIATALGLHAHSDCGRLDDERNQCIAILSRWPLRDTGRLATDSDRAYAVTTTIDAPTGPLRVVCVHLAGTWRLDLQHVAETTARRAREVAHLLNWLDAHATEALIVGGDFNPLSPEQNAALNTKLRRADAPGPTFPSHAPVLDLDRIYFSPALHARDTLIRPTDASDHCPLYADLRLDAPPATQP